MKHEIINNLHILKIGFGTAQLGGRFLANRSRDAFYLSALRSAIELGYTHFDTADFYSFGHAEELIGRAVHETNTKRENLFITTKVWPTRLTYNKVLRACESSLRRLQTEYIDLYLVHWPNPFVPLKETFCALNKLVKDGKVKHLGVSNFNVKLLKEAQSLSETPIIADQVPYSLSKRRYAKNGLLEYCQQNNILVTAYTPISHGRIAANQILQSIANAHHATLHQIALAWLVNQPRVIAIPMSFNPGHQKENLEAADIQLTPSEMEQLNALR